MPSFPGLETQYECMVNNISNVLFVLQLAQIAKPVYWQQKTD